MQKIKNISVVILVVALVVLLCTSCSVEEDTQEVVGKVYYLNTKPEQTMYWQNLAEIYYNTTGVEVMIVTAQPQEYEATLKTEMKTQNPPTIFEVNGPVELEKWKDYCYDLSTSSLYTNLKSDEFALKDKNKALAVAYIIDSYGIIYNKELLDDYIDTEKSVISSIGDIDNFETLKEVVEDIQKKRKELGIEGAFASSGMDSSSDFRFKTYLANLPVYFEYQDRNINKSESIKGTYLNNFKDIWDLYINNSTVDPSLLPDKTSEDAVAEFALKKAVFYQNGTWAYEDISGYEVEDEDMGMLPIYIGVDGEENQGLCTGSENYWCVNKKAKQEDIKATLKFLHWVTTSQEGMSALSDDMGFVTPFETFTGEYESDNPLVKIANSYIDDGKKPVIWTITTVPNEKWSDSIGTALAEYAQGKSRWSAVESAFINDWTT